MMPEPTTEIDSLATGAPTVLINAPSADLDEHIQAAAMEDLLRRAGYAPAFTADCDDRIALPPPRSQEPSPGAILSGSFRPDISDSGYRILYLGVHIPRAQASSATSPAALQHFVAHGPVGCADRYTLSLLRSHGVDAFLTHCLTVGFARRVPNPSRQTKVFVVSHSRRILDCLPASGGPYIFISAGLESVDFALKRTWATELLRTYREQAKLVVTTSPRCALAVIAMGIPVVVFHPTEDEPQSERFYSLSEIVRVFRPEEATLVNWRGYTLDVSPMKLRLLDSFIAIFSRWRPLAPPRLAPIAPSWWPDVDYFCEYLQEPQRLARLARASAPDRQRWGLPDSYTPDSLERAKVAAQFIRDGSRVLEIGTGTAALRALVAHRCLYTGADLEPLDRKILVFDLDNDELPSGPWDTIVLLEVLEYIYHFAEALRKLTSATSHLVFSYYCVLDGRTDEINGRRKFGWISTMTERNITDELAANGFRLSARRILHSTADFDQIVFEFSR